jgi:hypothetical protein
MSEKDIISIWDLFNDKRSFLINFTEKDKLRIDAVVELGYIKKEKTLPMYCDIDGCENLIEEIGNDGNNIILRDTLLPEHTRTLPIDEAFTYELTDEFYHKFLYSLINNIANIHKIEYMDGFYLELDDKTVIASIFINNISYIEKNLVILLLKLSSENIPIFMIYNRYIDRREIYDIIKNFPFSHICVPLSISEDNLDIVKNNIRKFIYTYNRIKDLQNHIIESIPDVNSKELVKDIIVNPQYILSIINRLSVNEKDEKNDYNWRDFENLIRVLFAIIYHSRIDIGGINQPGKDIADAYFFVMDQDDPNGKYIKLIGIVDTKFSHHVDFSKETTEKYINYVKKLIGLHLKAKKPLVFVYLDESSRANTEKFVDRLAIELKTIDSYIVLVSLTSISILARYYLSLSLDFIKASNTKDKWYLINNLFDNNFLLKEGFEAKTSVNNSYYDLNESKFLDIIHRYVDERDYMLEKYFDFIVI